MQSKKCTVVFQPLILGVPLLQPGSAFLYGELSRETCLSVHLGS